MTRMVLVAAVLAAVCSLSLAQDKPRIRSADRKKIRETKETMRALAIDLKTLRSMTGAYPDKLGDIVDNQLREKVPQDGWGNNLVYKRVAERPASKQEGYDLISYGADGKAGGQGADADITFSEDGEVIVLSAEEIAAKAEKTKARRHDAQVVLARQEMLLLATAMHRKYAANTKWPEKLEDALELGDDSEATRRLRRCLTDPWEQPYEFKLLEHNNLALICRGEDRAAGGKGRAADFTITERDVRATSSGPVVNRWEWEYEDTTDWRCRDFYDAVVTFKTMHNRLPADLDEIVRARVRSGEPKDRWGGEYFLLVISDDEFYVVGMGEDGAPGGYNDAADVIAPSPGEAPYRRDDEVPEADPRQYKLLVETAETYMHDIIDQVLAHKDETGEYPVDIEAMADRFVNGVVPLDPWGHTFELEYDKGANGLVTGFRVICRGEDGAPGGADRAQDFALNQEGERVELEGK